MSDFLNNTTVSTLGEIQTRKNLFVEIENASYAAIFRSNPSGYAYPWQIVFTPDTHQIWTQGDFYGISSEDFTGAINELKSYYAAVSAVIGDRPSSFAYQHPELIGEGVTPEDASVITTVENYLYSYISKEIDDLNNKLISSYTSVTYAPYDAANAYVTVSSEHNDATGTAYTVELHNAAAYSYVQSAYSYIENQINDINRDINDTSVSITYDAPVEGKAYVTASVVENENFPGVTYNLSLHNVSSYTDMISYVNDRITSLVNGAPEALDTLKEIADWISTNPQEGATNLITRVQNLETSYQTADSYIISGYQTADTNIITGYQTADTNIITGYQTADTNIITGYQTAIQNLENNSYFNVNFGDDNDKLTTINHTETLDITGDTVKGVKWTDTTNGGNQATGTINDAIEALENRIHVAEGDGIQQISSTNGSITGSKTGTTYTLETDANIIPVTTDNSKNYFNADVSNPDTIEEALVNLDAQIKLNETGISNNKTVLDNHTSYFDSLFEALQWTIVN